MGIRQKIYEEVFGTRKDIKNFKFYRKNDHMIFSANVPVPRNSNQFIKITLQEVPLTITEAIKYLKSFCKAFAVINNNTIIKVISGERISIRRTDGNDL